MSSSGSRVVKHVTTACNPCRQGKVKCSGQNPCRRCLSKNINCTWSLIPDQRIARNDLKRKLDDLEQEASVLRDIVDILQSTPDDVSASILSIIRSGADCNEIHQCIKHHLAEDDRRGREHSPVLDELNTQIGTVVQNHESSNTISKQYDARPIKRILDVARLIDDPPFRVPAKPWTTVIDDDDLTSHLVSLWITWDQWLGGVVAIDLFVRDMQAADINCRFCSPFLVNCILAIACLYSDFREARPKNGVPSALQQEFVAEATRIWQSLEQRPPTVTMLQGASLLAALAGLSGNDRLDLELLGSVADLAEALESEHLGTEVNTVEERELQDAISIACWGCFTTSLATCVVLDKPRRIALPRSPISSRQDKRSAVWQSYPKLQAGVPSNLVELRRSVSGLMEIYAQLLDMTVPSSLKLQKKYDADWRKSILALHDKAKSWYNTLPPCLRPQANATPDVLMINAWYQKLLLDIDKALRKPMPTTDPYTTASAANMGIDAVVAIGNIVRVYQSALGFDRIPAAFVCPIFSALQKLTVELPLTDSTEDGNHTALVTGFCIFLRAVGRRCLTCVALLRMHQIDVERQGRKLPAATKDLFVDFEARELESLDVLKLHSVIPAPSYTREQSPENISWEAEEDNLADFLRRYGKLNIKDKDTRGQHINAIRNSIQTA